LVVLDPNEKMTHFKKYWDDTLQKEAVEHAERIVSVLKTEAIDCINICPCLISFNNTTHASTATLDTLLL
jgi:hypothetical protein